MILIATHCFFPSPRPPFIFLFPTSPTTPHKPAAPYLFSSCPPPSTPHSSSLFYFTFLTVIVRFGILGLGWRPDALPDVCVAAHGTQTISPVTLKAWCCNPLSYHSSSHPSCSPPHRPTRASTRLSSCRQRCVLPTWRSYSGLSIRGRWMSTRRTWHASSRLPRCSRSGAWQRTVRRWGIWRERVRVEM